METKSETVTNGCNVGRAASQFQLVGNLRRYVLEADRRAREALEADTVERQPRQLAHLHLPLDERVGTLVAVRADEHVPFRLLIAARVGGEHGADFADDGVRLHRARRLHAPREAQ